LISLEHRGAISILLPLKGSVMYRVLTYRAECAALMRIFIRNVVADRQPDCLR
jgi:hypothetical protein